ncbi:MULTISPECIES: 7,8-didemethyl-8-hydroxy-5-deazariboflavin synthase CofG [Candidatus Nitrosocaldus]|jgi:7,8-didemethyl-8-hydroxy-5-deazariboflavin synthase CofG subunit|uniref:7,8-didemethyl-8-hydroxy-5-deazariboflavin synthase n=1 Tax=Candidatus Nitrosocaldus cavascurensis TaxID=2058097 RepID=A0A2K5AQX3_9ARCH|nr:MULTISPECIES: 7,8-didemethyl-8-hydroxy-5-deazariboflavin synthase CofG [Candidatus Nitrosocaldus]SPC34056.1 FO synthase subunit 1 [Candidatus Nitrosocaldus cavascurensis]
MLIGKGISRDDAYRLVCYYNNNDDDNDDDSKHDTVMMVKASMIRDSVKGRIVTYSRKVFIPITYLCRDYCSYCTYRKEPSSVDADSIILKPEHILAIAEEGKRVGCTEALLVAGERPEQLYPEARSWFRARGYASTIEYIADMSRLVLEKVGLLPHTNAGNLTLDEVKMLKEYNASIGLMLENASTRLMGKGMAHEHAPSKHPLLRLKTMENAGKARVAFTTGLLLGIGESMDEVVESLIAIREMHERYKHIQEIIIQNFNPKPNTPMADHTKPSREYMLRVVALARLIMPYMNIQVPPNLNPDFGEFLNAGINDWGGISPVTIDHVNPEAPWPSIDHVRYVTEAYGFRLRARFPVYPEYISEEYLSSRVMEIINRMRDEHGLVRGY